MVGIADVQTVRVVVRDSGGRVVHDETYDVVGASVEIDLQIQFRRPCQTFVVELLLLDSAGDTVFEANPSETELCEGMAPPVAEPVLSYVGVGADAQSVTIDPPSAVVYLAETFSFSAMALGPGNVPISGTPVRWSTLDHGLASVPDETTGLVMADAPGTARIRAELLTGQTATALLEIEERPTLERDPATFVFQAYLNFLFPAPKTLSVRNAGAGTLEWTASESLPWLSVSPASGTSSGETDAVLVQVDATGLAPGTYEGTITTSGLPGTIGSPQATTVSLTVGALSPLSGRVTNATNGAPLQGASVQLRTGHDAPVQDPVVGSYQTDANGDFAIADQPPGDYTITVALTGFVSGVSNTVVPAGGLVTHDVALLPVLPPGQTRIILSWGALPTDLDGHLFGPAALGGTFHIYYDELQDPPLVPSPDVSLDQDDDDGFGPETTTIHLQRPGRYCFTVFNYNHATDAPLATGATVRVQQGDQIIATFDVPNQQGNLWTVFALDEADLTPIDLLTMELEPTMPPAACGGAGPSPIGTATP